MQLVLLLFLGLAFIVGPIAANIFQHPLGAVPTLVLIVSGVSITVVAAILMVITKLYQKTKANEAFVRTGLGGMKVVQDGGAIVFPVVHQIVYVSLATIRLQVSRVGSDALITLDKLRADVAAEFYVRVQPRDEDIKSAARAFGDKMGDTSYVTKLVEDKLISALRTVAARQSLDDLNSKRDEFIREVTKIVEPDLAHNGLTLETATISRLDQTDAKNLNPTNVFDADGLRTIARITQSALTERNKLEREGEQARVAMDVATRTKVLSLQQQQAEAEAQQGAAVKVVQADKDREAREKQIVANKAVELAEVERAKAVEIAQLGRAQATEVAERAKQEAVAEAETRRAMKEAERAKADAAREAEMQNVTTVQVTAEAEREGQKMVIAATAAANQQYVTAAKQADGAAYKVKAEAEAKKAAADAEAEAVEKRAAAEASAAKKRAEADQCTQLVPVTVRDRGVDVDKKAAMIAVDVAARQVEVDQERVSKVLKPELEVRKEHGAAAQEFELARLQIEKEAEVRIAAAGAVAQVYGKISATVYGSPEDVAKVGEAVVRGIQGASVLEGLFSSAGPAGRQVMEQVGEVVRSVAGAVGRRLDRTSPNPPDEGGDKSAK